MAYGLLALFLATVSAWWFVTRPAPEHRAIVIDATRDLQELYNEREFMKIASLLEGQPAGSGGAPLFQRRAFLERLLPNLRTGTGSCDIESARYRAYGGPGESITVRAALSCEASPLTYFATWSIETQARLIEFQIDGNMWRSVPGLWDHRKEVVGIEE